MYSFKEKNKHKKKIIIISSVIVITFLLYYSLKLDRKIYLVENGCKSIVTVIEKDPYYANYLKEKYKGRSNVTVIEGDALEFDFFIKSIIIHTN